MLYSRIYVTVTDRSFVAFAPQDDSRGVWCGGQHGCVLPLRERAGTETRPLRFGAEMTMRRINIDRRRARLPRRAAIV